MWLKSVQFAWICNVGSQDSTESHLSNFRAFKQFLKEYGPFDIFIDGANIAHYKQNFDGGFFNYSQIQMILDHLQEEGYHALIILHEHHFNNPNSSLPEVPFAFFTLSNRSG